VNIVRAIRFVLMEGLFLNTLGSVAEIPTEHERNSWGARILEFGGEEDGLRSLFFYRDLHATNEEAALFCIFCSEDRKRLGKWREIWCVGMYRDVPLFQRRSEPEIEWRFRSLKECSVIIDVVGENIVIVGVIL